MSSENEFIQGAAGSDNITFVEAGRRKPGSLLMMKGEFPCKVVNFSTAKPGKHGSAKAMIMGKDIFTDKQYEETFGTGDQIPAPVVVNTEYTCIDIDDEGVLMLLDPNGEMKEDVTLPLNCAHLKDVCKLAREIIKGEKKGLLVRVQKWGELEQVVGVREGEDL